MKLRKRKLLLDLVQTWYKDYSLAWDSAYGLVYTYQGRLELPRDFSVWRQKLAVSESIKTL